MAETTPKKPYYSPRKLLKQQLPPPPASSSISLTPKTPQTLDPLTPRRSSRRRSLLQDPATPQKPFSSVENPIKDLPQIPNLAGNEENLKQIDSSLDKFDKDVVETTQSLRKGRQTRRSKRNGCGDDAENPKPKQKDGWHSVEVVFSPVSPELSETKKRKREDCCEDRNKIVTRSKAKPEKGKVDDGKKKNKTRVYYRKVIYDGGEFAVGDDVYVKRREDASSDDEDPEVEECRICFKAGKKVMIECDDCLGGFHLKCLKPPLKEVPEGKWVCTFCEVRKLGKEIELPKPPEGKRRTRTMREKLLSSDLWAAHIERFDHLKII